MTKWAFSKPQFTLMFLAILFFSGISSYLNMPRDEDPSYIMRAAQIRTSMPGASPERVEWLVTDKLEEVIQEMPEIDFIESQSKTGVSIITVNILESYKDMRPIWDKLRRKVEEAAINLPETASVPFVDDEFGDVYGVVFSIIGDGFNYATIKDVADEVRDELLYLPLVAKVDILGAQDERVFIDYDNAKLAELQLSPTQLGEILSKRNIISSGGIFETPIEQLVLEPTGDFESVDDIRETLIEIPGTDKIVPLRELATVYRSYIDPPVSKMRFNGEPCLGIAVSMRKGGNIVELGDQVSTLLKSLRTDYPIGIEFEMVAFQPERVTEKISGFVGNLLQAIVVVCLVMLLFLGVRTGLIVASLIPVAVVISFLVMSTMNIGLDQVSLASLIIALGMLVDNSIVMCESILVQIGTGKAPKEAAIDSARELQTPLLISSLTTAAAFLPIYLAESATGEFCASIFKVVTITLLCSWVVALTFIPLLCVRFLKPSEKKEVDPLKESKTYAMYREGLITMLCRPRLTMGVMVGALLLAIVGLGFVPKIFFPPNENALFTMELDLPIGSPLKRTEKMMEEVDAYIQREWVVTEEGDEGIVKWASYIGNGGPRWRLQHDPEAANPYYSFSLLTTTSFDAIFPAIRGLDDYLFNTFPDIKAKIRPLETGSPVSNPVEVRITGRDKETLFELTDQIIAKLETISGTRNVVDDWGLQTKKIVVDIDEARAARAGVTNSDVAYSLEAAISGVTITEYREKDKVIPVVLRSVAAKDSSLIGQQAFNIHSQSTGKSLPVRQVADVDIEWQAAENLRRDRFKTVTISCAKQESVTSAEITNELIPWVEEASKKWPPGYRWEMGGEFEKSGDANASIVAKLPIAGMLILILLMGQFNCARKTAIILLTIPLSIIGVTAGLLVMRSYFGFMTLLGIISLAGIVINNAIVLIDRIQLEIDENGLSPQNAIIVAAQRRLRPILLTTVTTVAGLIPLWLGGGLMWEPMAIAIIFGLVVATVLTLGVIPVLYRLLFKVDYQNFTYDSEPKK